MIEQLNGYDWEEVFKSDYATPHAVLGYTGSLERFEREDVMEVTGIAEGENDGEDWVCFGLLKDGRWFAITAGCDYTGWG